MIPIKICQRITTTETVSEAELSEGIEDYCLNKAMDQAKKNIELIEIDKLGDRNFYQTMLKPV